MPLDASRLPRYQDLPIRQGFPKGSAWGVFGDEDQLGTLNLLRSPAGPAAATGSTTPLATGSPAGLCWPTSGDGARPRGVHST
jgi:hypothetical protein